MSKTKILIEAFHTPDSGGGFLWCRADGPGAWELHREYERDVERGYAHVALIEIAVDSVEDENAVTEYIDNELLDLLETRQIGKIIKAHDRWGDHPYDGLHPAPIPPLQGYLATCDTEAVLLLASTIGAADGDATPVYDALVASGRRILADAAADACEEARATAPRREVAS